MHPVSTKSQRRLRSTPLISAACHDVCNIWDRKIGNWFAPRNDHLWKFLPSSDPTTQSKEEGHGEYIRQGLPPLPNSHFTVPRPRLPPRHINLAKTARCHGNYLGVLAALNIFGINPALKCDSLPGKYIFPPNYSITTRNGGLPRRRHFAMIGPIMDARDRELGLYCDEGGGCATGHYIKPRANFPRTTPKERKKLHRAVLELGRS